MAPNHRDRPDPFFLTAVRHAARRCGVTRLADVTGLDRIGLPVWQAVRPASRALSVHQGKALSVAAAQLGALCEAIESHCAEQVEADGPICAVSALPTTQRPADPTDFLMNRSRHPDWDEPVPWSTAVDLITDCQLFLPHAFVSLDLRFGVPSRWERSSNGLGAGPDEAHALATALFELIERDALARWNAAGQVARLASRIEPETIPFDWFQTWRARIADLGGEVDVFAIKTVTGAPAFRCTIGGDAAFGIARRLAVGCACHADGALALVKAFAEAVQTRLTLIAGVRDDLLFRHYLAANDPGAPGGWPPGQTWRDTNDLADPIGETVDRLAERGYRQIAVKRLDRNLDGVVVIKAFVPGLGLEGRSRRVPT